jgi:hypothetical protein
VRGAHLAENLRLADDERVEARRDAAEVPCRVLVGVVERRSRRAETGELGLGAQAHPPCVRSGDVQLGAVARREHDRLEPFARKPFLDRRGGCVVEPQTLAPLERRMPVRRPE